jgi:Acetyltransferase (GNAT) domain
MDVHCKPAHLIAASEWDAFVASSPQGNIYHLHAYLSHLLPAWSAVMVYEGNAIVAAFPFEQSRKWGISYALQPYFAQYLGILWSPVAVGQPYKRLEFQKKTVQLIAENLPREVRFWRYNFAPEYDYDLPLLWLGWQHKLLLTYWVDIRRGYDHFLASCASHVRREIKKAEQSGIVVHVENAPEKVIAILKTAKPEVVQNIPQRFWDGLEKNARHFYNTEQSRCFIAYADGVPVAGIIYFFYGTKMIYYQGSALPAYKNAGAMSIIIAESVRLYAGQYQYLDFDGSMIESIERFFRGFGACPVRYSQFTLNRLPHRTFTRFALSFLKR